GRSASIEETRPFPMSGKVLIDAGRWLRHGGLPVKKTLARLRSMDVEDEYLLVRFVGPGVVLTERRHVSVVITRECDEYELSVEWHAHLGRNALRRGHLSY